VFVVLTVPEMRILRNTDTSYLGGNAEAKSKEVEKHPTLTVRTNYKRLRRGRIYTCDLFGSYSRTIFIG